LADQGTVKLQKMYFPATGPNEMGHNVAVLIVINASQLEN